MTNHGIIQSLGDYISGKKKNLHCKAKRTNSPADWNNFRMIRNLYTGKIREAISKYKADLALKLNEGLVSTNPKSWWHIARQFMGKKKLLISRY